MTLNSREAGKMNGKTWSQSIVQHPPNRIIKTSLLLPNTMRYLDANLKKSMVSKAAIKVPDILAG